MSRNRRFEILGGSRMSKYKVGDKVVVEMQAKWHEASEEDD